MAIEQSPGNQSTLAPAIESLLDPLFSADEPGVAIGLYRAGEPLYRRGYGRANVELGVPIIPETVFRIASVTKQFTAVAILMLEEAGKLALSDEITRFLPDYPAQGRAIRVEHLLTHTSGIQSYTDLPEWEPLQRTDLTLTELLDLFKDRPMQFEPGERHRYNNSGYVLLGAIVEKLSGQPYTEFLRERIFEPLGMTSSRYDDTARIIPNRAAGYSYTATGVVNASYLSMTQPHAAGGLLSTVDDLALWYDALHDNRLIRADTRERAWSPYILNNGEALEYGYGWGFDSLDGRRIVEHSGGIHGFLCNALYVPDDRLLAVALMNSTKGDPDPKYLTVTLSTLALGKPLEEPVEVPLDVAPLGEYPGVYPASEHDRIIVSIVSGRLFVERWGRKTEVHLASTGDFFPRNSFTRYQFDRDPITGEQTLTIRGRTGKGVTVKRDRGEGA